jgi:hypothetical protein
MNSMNNDDAIDARLTAASDTMVDSFSKVDADAALRAVRDGAGSAPRPSQSRRRVRWLAVAAATVLIAGGAAFAAGVAMRSRNDSTPSITPTPDSTPTVTESTPTDPPTSTTPTTSAAPSTTTTETSLPAVPVTTVRTTPTIDPPTADPANINDVFVTVSSGNGAVIDVRDAAGLVGSFDLTCPATRDCKVQSATVMGDLIWVAITDTEPGQPDLIDRSRVVSVTRSTGEITEHLALEGGQQVRSAGRGADGVLRAYLDAATPEGRQLVAIEQGGVRVLAAGVSGFKLSDDGRFLAVSFSNPPAGEPARFTITDLVDNITSEYQTSFINAGPAAWSPDGRYLIVDEQWEDNSAWVIDPWSGSGDPLPGAERILDGGCFISNDIVAHRTWSIGYGQGDAQPGVIRLTSLATGSTVADIGEGLFGDGFRCHPDGSVSYLRRPVAEVQYPGFTQLEPVADAPLELVHIAADGTTSITASGDLRLV